jgi:hypothetical protein
MNRSSFNRFALAALLAAGAMPLSALRTTQAQPPSALQPFTTRIYIQNPNPSAATGIVNFYDQGTGNQPSVNVPFNLKQQRLDRDSRRHAERPGQRLGGQRGHQRRSASGGSLNTGAAPRLWPHHG